MRQQRALYTMPGYRALALLDQVKRMSNLLQGNVTQYRQWVAQLQDPRVSLPIMDVRNPDAHDDMLLEAERLLHNVLTALSTRVDQLRVFKNKHLADDTALTDAYQTRIAAAASFAAYIGVSENVVRPEEASGSSFVDKPVSDACNGLLLGYEPMIRYLIYFVPPYFHEH
jgi:hypothetical protein